MSGSSMPARPVGLRTGIGAVSGLGVGDAVAHHGVGAGRGLEFGEGEEGGFAQQGPIGVDNMFGQVGAGRRPKVPCAGRDRESLPLTYVYILDREKLLV